MSTTRKDLATAAASISGLPPQEADHIIRAFLLALTERVAAGERIEIRRFGTFDRHWKKARMARNPKTGSPAAVPAHYVVRFRPSPELLR
jgi:nucleoid DNA-binding protein